MQHDITADWHTLMRQATGTAHQYLREAIQMIDGEFGDGYAKGNPVLVGAFIQAAATDFHAAVVGLAAQKVRDAIQTMAK